MQKFEKLISTVYNESDFSRSIATALAGIAGLVTYLWKTDWVISAFTALIVFPITRIITGAIQAKLISLNKSKAEESRLQEQFDSFSPEEKKILRFFVVAGGACVSWGYVDRSQLPFPRPALNSLMSRGLVYTSVMEDGMTESFGLDIEIFDLAQKHLSEEFF